jgi:hypothetical protein
MLKDKPTKIFACLFGCILFMNCGSAMILSQEAPSTEKAKSQETSVGKIIITGTLLKNDDSPMDGLVVCLFVVTDKSMTLEINDGQISNPNGKTDAKGKFTIEADPNYIKDGQKFTVGIIGNNRFGGTKAVQRNGMPFTLKFSSKDRTKRFDLGKVTVEN